MGRRKGKSASAASRTEIDADNDILSEHYTITGSIGDNDSSFAAWDDDEEAEGACIACLYPVLGYADTSTTALLRRR
jgi:hypothetical protein